MSYQPYPTGGGYQPYSAGGNQLGQQPPQPSSVRNAVWLMYAGAALSALGAVLILVLSSSIKTSLGNALATANQTLKNQGKKQLTVAQIHAVETSFIVVAVVILLIGLGLWLWMAWANGKGRNWARIVATVLFALYTILLVLFLRRAGVALVFGAVTWLVGLGAIILLWRRESSEYIQAGRPR